MNNKFIKSFIFFLTFLIFTSHIAEAKLYRIGDKVENEIKFSKKFKLPLADGDWYVVDRYGYSYYFLHFKGVAVARIENKEIMEAIYVERANLSGKEMAYVDNSVISFIFKDKYDGCYQRPEYYIVEVYKRGSTHNCLVARHYETEKELYTPDDPLRGSAQIKKWINDNSIKVPPITFHSFHSYFSRLNRGEWYAIQYMANPKLYDSPKLKYLTEETSEFHKAIISEYPEHKITMDKWLSVSSKRHRYLEKLFKAKKNHLLDIEKYLINSEIDKDTNTVEQLEKLNQLLKSGVLTEDEFKKAKDKILN